MDTKWSRLGAVGSALALAAAITACASPASSPGLRIVTSDFATASGMEALLDGTLAVDDDGCIHASSPTQYVTLVWPKGYTAAGDSASFEILDADKNVVARSEDNLKVGGGGVDNFRDAWTEPECAKGDLWVVGEID